LIHFIRELFFPEVCVVCNRPLSTGEKIICRKCLYDLPLTHYEFDNKNALARQLQVRTKLHKAIALMFYGKFLSSSKLIHALKYKGRKEIGPLLAQYLTEPLSKDPPDIIIPIPLHPEKRKLRGYNQTEGIAQTLANELGSSYHNEILIKTLHNPSQTKKKPLERDRNVQKVFDVKNKNLIRNKHILLVDDVITTGSTISHAANELYKHGAGKISVACLAFKKD